MKNVFELNHPLANHHLARLRATATAPEEFRASIRRLSGMLAYEATRDLATQPIEVQTPITTMTGQALSQTIGVIPILRAGLGMVDPVLDMLPQAEVWHLGLYRDEETALPVEYYSKLPKSGPVEVGLVIDPMLATGGSSLAALGSLQRWGVQHLKLLSIIASKPGIETVHAEFPDAQIYVCKVDPELNDRKYIVPGLGDAGDRIFNTLRSNH